LEIGSSVLDSSRVEFGMRSEAIETTESDGRRLRVEFRWRGDRFGHLISVANSSGETIAVLESVEGTPDDAWPPSPALQSLSIENHPQGPVALLVGMAGASYWSASIEALLSPSAIRFGIACRLKNEPHWLGSRYQLLTERLEELVSINYENARVALEGKMMVIEPVMLKPVNQRWSFLIRPS
jgi:hypothetical protein